jgi:hypothetical protein
MSEILKEIDVKFQRAWEAYKLTGDKRFLDFILTCMEFQLALIEVERRISGTA